MPGRKWLEDRGEERDCVERVERVQDYIGFVTLRCVACELYECAPNACGNQLSAILTISARTLSPLFPPLSPSLLLSFSAYTNCAIAE